MNPSEWYKTTENEYINKRYVMFGLGNGEYVSEVLNNCKTEVKIIVYEPAASGLGRNEEEYLGLKGLSEAGVEIYVEGKEKDNFTNFLYNFVDYSTLQGLILFTHPDYERNSGDSDDISLSLLESFALFDQSVKSMESGIRASRLVEERFGRESFENMIKNYHHLINSRSLSSLIENIDKDVPAIIVASGPSLAKNIHLLNQAKGKSFIISADSAVSALLVNNIEPDIYVSTDPHKEAKSFEDIRTKNIPAMVELTSSVSAIKNEQVHFFTFNKGNSYLEKFIDEENVDMHLIGVGGSVANTCFDAAIAMGFKTIIFIGLDLAYTGNKTHVENTARHGMAIDESTALFTEDIFGDQVKSSGEFMIYKSLIEDEISVNPDLNVIDATEGGAYVNGTKIMTFKDAIDKYCIKEFDAKGAINSSSELFDSDQKEKLGKHIEKIESEIKSLINEFRKSLRNYDEMYMMAKLHNLNKGRLSELLSDNEKISACINSNPVLLYLEYLAQEAIHEVQENAYKHNADIYEEILEAASIGQNYAKAMIEAGSKAVTFIGKNPIK